MITPVLTTEQYATERAICDRAQAYADSIMRPTGGKTRNYLTAAEAAHPDYTACNNDMRGRVEQYELLTDPPERLVAYAGKVGLPTVALTTWTGDALGIATITSSWRVRSYIGSTMHQFTARIAGREYTGRGFGDGMCLSLRETAASRRKRESEE